MRFNFSQVCLPVAVNLRDLQNNFILENIIKTPLVYTLNENNETIEHGISSVKIFFKKKTHIK